MCVCDCISFLPLFVPCSSSTTSTLYWYRTVPQKVILTLPAIKADRPLPFRDTEEARPFQLTVVNGRKGYLQRHIVCKSHEITRMRAFAASCFNPWLVQNEYVKR